MPDNASPCYTICMDTSLPDEPKLNDILYALSDAVRFDIARTIYRSAQPLTCTQATAHIADLPISSRSHCFKILREKGIIRTDIQGREHLNSIRTQEIDARYPGLLQAIFTTQQ